MTVSQYAFNMLIKVTNWLRPILPAKVDMYITEKWIYKGVYEICDVCGKYTILDGKPIFHAECETRKEAMDQACLEAIEEERPMYWTCDVCGRGNHESMYPCQYCDGDPEKAKLPIEDLI